MATAVSRWNFRKLKLPCPLLSRFQSDLSLRCSRINAQHLFVLLIAEVHDVFRFLFPRIPHNNVRQSFLSYDKCAFLLMVQNSYYIW
ncbi:hypothetical protein EE612_031229 [Oryza sativa]|nr:hypothetical protein EE612_031229 [Oryza sativa]